MDDKQFRDKILERNRDDIFNYMMNISDQIKNTSYAARDEAVIRDQGSKTNSLRYLINLRRIKNKKGGK